MLILVNCTINEGVLDPESKSEVIISNSNSSTYHVFINNLWIDSILAHQEKNFELKIGTHHIELYAINQKIQKYSLTLHPDSVHVIQVDQEANESSRIIFQNLSNQSVFINGLNFDPILDSSQSLLYPIHEDLLHIRLNSGNTSYDTTLNNLEPQTHFISAQLGVKPQILIERISNVSCNSCPEFTGVLHQVLDSIDSPDIHEISYHASWPEPFDPIYLSQTDYADDIVKQYGPQVNYSLPLFSLNGQVIDFKADPILLKSQIINQIEELLKRNPQFEIFQWQGEIQIQVIGDIHEPIQVEVIQVQVQRFFENAPGSNGDQEFSNLFNKQLFQSQFELGPGFPKVIDFKLDKTLDPNSKTILIIKDNQGHLLESSVLQ